MTRRLVTIVVAIGLGLAGTIAVLLYVKGADDRAVAGKRATAVLVAGRTIPAGTPISALVSGGYLRTERFPADSVPPDAVGSVGQLPADNVVRDNVPAGELLRSTVVVPRGSTSAFTVPNGKIAVSVQLSDPQRVAGYVKPGSKVVVFSTGIGADPKGKQAGTRTLLIDVEVLSVGAASSNASGSLVTLAVTQQEAERLIYSAGGLYLGLEGDASNLSPSSPGVTALTLFGG